MNKLKVSALAAALLFGAAVTTDAFAQRRHGGGGGHRHAGHHHHGHHHHRGSVSIGVGFGSPFWYGYGWPHYAPYYRPYYGYPAVVGVPAYAAGPATYVEQGQPAYGAAAPEAGYWYYCNESQAYYPHVQQCAGPWQRVAPQPPS